MPHHSINRKRVYTIIQVGNLHDIPSRTYDIVLMIAVLLNLFIAIFETFPQSAAYLPVLDFFETVTVLFFTADYALRIWTADYYYEHLHLPATEAGSFYQFKSENSSYFESTYASAVFSLSFQYFHSFNTTCPLSTTLINEF